MGISKLILTSKSSIGSLTDEDGNIYTTVTIGTQTWMVENLKTTKYNDGTPILNFTTDASWISSEADNVGAYCWYNNDKNTYEVYGALYNHRAVLSGKLAPVGWKVPSYSDWATLVSYIGGEPSAGLKLKETGTVHWNSPNNATNEYGFTALGSGERSNLGVFRYNKDIGFWWTALDIAVYVYNNGDGIIFPTGYDYKHGLGVRCILDSSPSSNSNNKLHLFGNANSNANKLKITPEPPPAITDYDGNVYTEVVIGTQTWLLENLRTTHYNNGDEIKYQVFDASGGYVWPNNDINNKNPYGALYNWYVIDDARGIAPSGYHVPTLAEMNTLFTYLGGTSVAGGKLKETGTDHWNATNNASNESGFTAVGAGWYTGSYNLFRTYTLYWMATEGEPGSAYRWYVSNTGLGVTVNTYYYNYGLSIRCIKDS